MIGKRSGRWMLPLSFVLPAGLYLLVMVLARVHPFGNDTLLLWDVNSQYIPFLNFWKAALTGTQDIWYILGNALGSGTADMVAYYLASPLNAVMFLFDDMMNAVTALMLLKIGLCGVTAFIYLRKTRKLGAAALVFSTTYALMGFVAVYFYNFIWLDGLILLPLIVLGYLRIAEGKSPLFYILTLGLALFCQFYIAYMICVFMCLYLVYDLLLHRRRVWRVIGTFVLASVLAAALTAVLLLPAYLAIAHGPEPVNLLSGLTLRKITTLRAIFTKVYTASSGVMAQRSGPPNFYIGIPLSLLSLLFFFNRAIPLKRRLVTLGFLAVFMVSFLIDALNLAWHAFEAPTFYPARYSFLFSFLLIDMAAQSLETLRAFPKRRLLWTLILATGAFTGITAYLFIPLTVEYLALKTIIMDVLVFGASGLCLWLGLHRMRWRRLCILAICIMQMTGLLLNSYYAYRRIAPGFTPTAEGYRTHTAQDILLAQRVQSSDDGLYRMEFDTHWIDNAAIAYDFNGMSHNISLYRAALYDFAKAMGMRESHYRLLYRNGLSPVTESLLGLKYIVRKDGTALEAQPEFYKPVWRDGAYTCYENTCAMPLAYLAPPQTVTLTDYNPFVNQNLMLEDVLGDASLLVLSPIWDIHREYDGKWETDTFSVEKDRLLYLKTAGAQIRFNGGEIEDGWRYQTTVLLPVAAEETTYELQMTVPLGIHLAYFDSAAFQTAMEKLKPYGALVTSDTDSQYLIKATVTDSHNRLLIAIPFDEGWRVWVDGERAEATARYGALLEVALSPGEHTVELLYRPRGLWAGAAVSLLAIAGLALWMALRKRKNNKRSS